MQTKHFIASEKFYRQLQGVDHREEKIFGFSVSNPPDSCSPPCTFLQTSPKAIYAMSIFELKWLAKRIHKRHSNFVRERKQWNEKWIFKKLLRFDLEEEK